MAQQNNVESVIPPLAIRDDLGYPSAPLTFNGTKEAKPKETPMNDERRKSFEAAARPLIKWLNDNVPHPHHSVIVTQTDAELLEGTICTRQILDYIKD